MSAQNSRKSTTDTSGAKVATKEREDGATRSQNRRAAKKNSKAGFMDSLFGQRKNQLVPVDKTDKKTGKKREESPAQPKVDPIRLQETVVTPRPKPKPEVTSPSQLQSRAKESSAKKEINNQQTVILAILLMVVSFAVAGSYKFMKDKKQAAIIDAETAAIHKAAEELTKDRVSFHRSELGRRLNRDRIEVEVANQKTASALSPDAKPEKGPDMMSGLPLAPENTNRPSSRDRLIPANPDMADARIMYTLQEQQQKNFYEEDSRQRYIEEFVANAESAGYRVKVDENGVVTVLGKSNGPLPSQRPTGKRGPSSANPYAPGMAQ